MQQRPTRARTGLAEHRPASPMVRDIGEAAMTLLIEARNYFTAKRADNSTIVTYYRMVVTNRLIWVMAWVLYQKAVENGEMAVETATEAMAEILESKGEPSVSDSIPGDLPAALLSLVYRSGALRERVVRLVAGARSVRPLRARAARGAS